MLIRLILMNARLAPSLRSSAPWRRRGQNLTEYALITFLVALGTIGVVGLFGDNLRQLFGTNSESLAGASTAQNGGSAPSADVSKWSIKGSGGSGGNPGGSSNSGGSDTND
ncbi:hypothetical protein D187_005032 [Cystobacter fuscus DSM 2262]|uniref:Flp/Fap pilin component n=2 Tax=Cystobacter fuscus TaxID=43 RepID=S9PN40_CYSF2|nr:hypothetical protein D187_005032 [Cystobacter fuscus DSM 2262]